MKINSVHDLHPEILGQLLIMQSIIVSLPNEASIFGFICRGLADLPGVKQVTHVKSKQEHVPASIVRLPIRTGGADYGELLIDVADPADLTPYRDYLKNFCVMVAIILEGRGKQRSDEEFTARLEQRVREHTSTLQESEEKFHAVCEASSDAIIIADKNGAVSDINKAAEQMFGYGREEITHVDLSRLMPERYREMHRKGIRRAISTGKTDYLNRIHEFHGLKKDGREFPLELNVSTWFVGGEQFFSGIIRDISLRKKAEKELKNSEEKLHTIFDATLDGILVAEAETRKLLTANRAICDMLGYTPQEITGLTVNDIHPVDNLPEVQRQFARQLRKELDVYHDAPMLRKDGTIFYADISATPTEIGGRKCMIGVFRDTSERKKLEDRVRQSQKLEAIGTLAGGIAHDFNNILSAIMGYSELALTKTEPGSEIYQDLEQVSLAASRARDLVKHILTFSRKSDTEIVPLRIQVIVKEVIKLLRSTFPTTITIHQDVDGNCAPINADATQIHQLIMNLSTNAFHSMEQLGGTLSIILKEVELPATMEHKRLNLKPGRYARLDVQDTGTGIEAGILSHIFDPYFTTKPRGKGTGLGLAVVYGIVENHGGKIICSSQPGVGTLFSVYLPVVESTDTRNAEIQAPLPKGTENILFIDDEETLALLGERTLASLGYTIFPMTESLQALEAFREDPSRYDLVITDQTMPRLTGSELAKEMLKIRPDIPIILCTGHSSIINAEKAKATGIKSFLMKPVSKKVMAEEVRKVLNEAALLKR